MPVHDIIFCVYETEMMMLRPRACHQENTIIKMKVPNCLLNPSKVSLWDGSWWPSWLLRTGCVPDLHSHFKQNKGLQFTKRAFSCMEIIEYFLFSAFLFLLFTYKCKWKYTHINYIFKFYYFLILILFFLIFVVG